MPLPAYGVLIGTLNHFTRDDLTTDWLLSCMARSTWIPQPDSMRARWTS